MPLSCRLLQSAAAAASVLLCRQWTLILSQCLQGAFDGRIYTLKLFCNQDYPKQVRCERAAASQTWTVTGCLFNSLDVWMLCGPQACTTGLQLGPLATAWLFCAPDVLACLESKAHMGFILCKGALLSATNCLVLRNLAAADLPLLCCQAPQVRFYSRINLPCVRHDGVVSP